MRSIVILITVSDDGHISVDARGKVGLEGIKETLKAALKLAEQGQVRGAQET
jgi:hypothetical protein